MQRLKKYELATIIFVSILIVLPFINQAYYIDDDIYLNAALDYNKSGFDSFLGESEQEGLMFPNYYITHPLLWPWMLSKAIDFFNSTKESLLHLISIINLLILGFSSLLIAKRFSKKPLIVTLFLLFLPSVVLLSHVMMTDVPTLAFFLLALSLHIEGIERKSITYIIFAGIAATIASGISYQALFVILLFIFYNIQGKERQFVSYLSSIIPVIFLIIWCIFTWVKIGIPHPFIAFLWGDSVTRNLLLNFSSKLVANINVIGAATIFPFFILLIYSIKSHFRKLVFISSVISIATIFAFALKYSLAEKAMFFIYFTSGFLILIRVSQLFINSIKNKNRQNTFLSFWALSFFIAVVIVMPLGVARYLLPAFLPLIIIFVEDVLAIFQGKNFNYIITIGLFLTISWSFLCSIADYKLSGTYRDFSEGLGGKLKNKNIWFCTDGLKWYMEKEGFKALLFNDKRPKKGDFVIISTEMWPYKVPEIMRRAQLIERVKYDTNFPFRTMNLGSHAGFYDHLKGALLPVSVTRGGLEQFYVYKIISNK